MWWDGTEGGTSRHSDCRFWKKRQCIGILGRQGMGIFIFYAFFGGVWPKEWGHYGWGLTRACTEWLRKTTKGWERQKGVEGEGKDGLVVFGGFRGFRWYLENICSGRERRFWGFLGGWWLVGEETEAQRLLRLGNKGSIWY